MKKQNICLCRSTVRDRSGLSRCLSVKTCENQSDTKNMDDICTYPIGDVQTSASLFVRTKPMRNTKERAERAPIYLRDAQL